MSEKKETIRWIVGAFILGAVVALVFALAGAF